MMGAMPQEFDLNALEEYGNYIVQDVFAKIHVALGLHLKVHYGGPLPNDFPVHAFSGKEAIRLGGEILAPCIILTGPDLMPTCGALENITVPNGKSEEGFIRTRTYFNAQYVKLGYSVAYFGENELDLLNASQKFTTLFNKRLPVPELKKNYTLRRREHLSGDNIVNPGGFLVTRGSLEVDQILILDETMFSDSGLVYNTHAEVTGVSHVTN